MNTIQAIAAPLMSATAAAIVQAAPAPAAVPSSAPAPAPASAGPSNQELQLAFDALRKYDQGSARGALLPIDRAVTAFQRDSDQAKSLRQTLATILAEPCSTVAKDYACRRLALIAGHEEVPALAALLAVPALAHPAAQALSISSEPKAAEALRSALQTLKDKLSRIAVLDALGALGDRRAIRLLAKTTRDADPDVRKAAIAGLGGINDKRAARVLQASIRDAAPGAPSAALGDAAIRCAERLRANNDAKSAQSLLQTVAESPSLPKHVRDAALRQAEASSAIQG